MPVVEVAGEPRHNRPEGKIPLIGDKLEEDQVDQDPLEEDGMIRQPFKDDHKISTKKIRLGPCFGE